MCCQLCSLGFNSNKIHSFIPNDSNWDETKNGVLGNNTWLPKFNSIFDAIRFHIWITNKMRVIKYGYFGSVWIFHELFLRKNQIETQINNIMDISSAKRQYFAYNDSFQIIKVQVQRLLHVRELHIVYRYKAAMSGLTTWHWGKQTQALLEMWLIKVKNNSHPQPSTTWIITILMNIHDTIVA